MLRIYDIRPVNARPLQKLHGTREFTLDFTTAFFTSFFFSPENVLVAAQLVGPGICVNLHCSPYRHLPYFENFTQDFPVRVGETRAIKAFSRDVPLFAFANSTAIEGEAAWRRTMSTTLSKVVVSDIVPGTEKYT